MGFRQATLLTPSRSSGTARLLSPLESTLMEVLILKSFKFFRMNTYEKHRGEGVLLLTTHPMRMRILSERSESKDLSSHPMRESVLRSIATKDLCTHPMRMRILSERSESKDLSSHEESSSKQALRPGEPLFHRSPACPEPAVVGGVASHPLAQTLSGPLAGRIFAAAPEGASHVRSHQTCHGHADSHRVR